MFKREYLLKQSLKISIKNICKDLYKKIFIRKSGNSLNKPAVFHVSYNFVSIEESGVKDNFKNGLINLRRP